MGRKVSVGLEADVSKFVVPVETAKKAVDDLGDKVDKLDRELDKIPPDVAKAAAAMKLLGGEADAAGKKVADIGDKRAKLFLLDAKIRETSAEVKKLTAEFLKTGNVDIFNKLGNAQGRLGALAKVRKDVADTFVGGVEDGLAGAAGSFELRKAAMAVGAAYAVPLVAALGGALTGAVGLGFAGVGLAGAVLGDPQRFQGAWGVAIRSVKDDFFKATAPFAVDVYSGLARIGPLVNSWHLDKIFGDARKYADPLFDGIEGLTTGLVKGVGALVEKGSPAVHALSDSMIILGDASKDALSSIADGAQGGAYALRDLASGLGIVVRLFGQVAGGAEKAYGFLHDRPELVVGALGFGALPFVALTDANGKTKELKETQHGLELQAIAAGHAFSQQGDDLTVLLQKLNATEVTTDSLAGTMTNKLFTALMGVDQASLSVNSSLLQVGKTFEQNGNQIDKHTHLVADNTEKGIANREAVLASVQANMQMYQSNLAVGMSASDAAAAYDEGTKKLEGQLRAAHLTDAQINDLIGTYRNIPDKVNTTIAIEGLTQAINDLDETLHLMAGIKDKTATVTVRTVYNDYTGYRKTGSSQLAGQQQYGGIRYHALDGMIVPPSNPGSVLFGEPQTGGEAFIPLQGIAPSRAAMLGQIAMSGYGYNVSPANSAGGNITITLAGGDDVTRAMLKSIRYEIRTGFGGSVQLGLGTQSR